MKLRDKIIQIISFKRYRSDTENYLYGLSESGKIYQFISAADGWQLITESPEG